MAQKRIIVSAITLRGIGSYAREARLDLRPVTLLAGANGTGKSTWIKVINELVQALTENRLPFALSSELWNSCLLHYYEDSDPNDPLWLQDRAPEAEYGFVGTIGLHGIVADDFILPSSEKVQAVPTDPHTSFFWKGSCTKGSQIRILLSLPCADERDYGQQVSVHLDGQLVFAFVRDQGEKSHAVLARKHLLPASNSPHAFTKIAGLSATVNEDAGTVKFEGPACTDEFQMSLCSVAMTRCRQLLAEMLGGFFYIGPIRQPVDYARFKKTCEDFYAGHRSQHPSVQNRYVGPQGEAFPEVYYNYSLNTMASSNADTPLNDADASSYFLESYYGHWMQHLTDVSPEYADTMRIEKPAGFTKPHPSPDERELTARSHRCHNDDQMYRQYEHRCFPFGGGLKAEITQLSSGFHQIAPLLLQGALLQRNETMLVENPEVHLHPSAQSRIMEYFVREAAVGKNFIIETHSDILVLRLLRAILSEELPQEQIRIYFAELARDTDRPWSRFHYSRLRPIEIDDQGRIYDWPDGFMDQQMKEFDFIMNARFMPQTDEDTEDA